MHALAVDFVLQASRTIEQQGALTAIDDENELANSVKLSDEEKEVLNKSDEDEKVSEKTEVRAEKEATDQ